MTLETCIFVVPPQGPVRPLNAVGIYSGGSSDGTRISRCPAHLLKINAEWINLPDRQQARHCHVCDIFANGCSYFLCI